MTEEVHSDGPIHVDEKDQLKQNTEHVDGNEAIETKKKVRFSLFSLINWMYVHSSLIYLFFLEEEKETR